MPCSEQRAYLLLERGRARVHCIAPLTIRLVDRWQEDCALQLIQLKLDPGSKTTSIALARDSKDLDAQISKMRRMAHVLFLAELHHRGHAIRDALTQRRAFRRRRCTAKLRYRTPRLDSRCRPQDWLAPSLRHRVDTTESWEVG